MSARLYVALRVGAHPVVDVIEQDGSRHLLSAARAHEFEWSYEGSGPCELARAILADAVGEEFAEPLYRDFARLYIAKQPEQGFVLPEPVAWAWAYVAHFEQQRVDMLRARGSRKLRVINGGGQGWGARVKTTEPVIR